MNSKGDMNPVSFLREELACDQLDVKINGVHRIPIVMELLDTPAKKKELEDLIKKLIIETPLIDDEILYSLARVIEKLASDNWEPWLGFLEALAGKEETVVRIAAVKSIVNIISKKSESNTGSNNAVKELLIRLMPKTNGKDGSTDPSSKNGKDSSGNQCDLAWTKAVSGIEIIAQIYPYVSVSERKELVSLFIKCTNSENIAPMVMRAVIANLGDIVRCVFVSEGSNNWGETQKDVIAALRELVNSEQMVPHTNGLKNLLTVTLEILGRKPSYDSETKLYFQTIVGLFARFVTSKDWKVRSHFAENLTDIMEVLKQTSLLINQGNSASISLDDQVEASKLDPKEKDKVDVLKLGKFVDDCMGDQEGDVRQIAVANSAKLIDKFNNKASITVFLKLLTKHNSPTDNIPLVQVGGLEIMAQLAENLSDGTQSDGLGEVLKSLQKKFDENDKDKPYKEEIDTEVHIYLIRAVCQIIKMSKRLGASPSPAQGLLQWLTNTMANQKAVKWRVKNEYYEAIRNLIGVFGVSAGGVCEILKLKFMEAWCDENWQVGNSNVSNLKDVIACFPLVFLEQLIRVLKDIIDRVSGKTSYLTVLNAYYGLGQIVTDIKLAKNLGAGEVESVKNSAWDMLIKPLDANVAPNTHIVILKCLDKICEGSSALNSLSKDRKTNLNKTITALSKNQDPDVQKFASDLLHRIPK